ncbi:hypothetical protein LB503_000168 [Fusarium chuoi]|nr:hypothetical protein LB503_000168 [Fusarium chuoi]
MSNLSAKPGTFFCDHCDPKFRFASEKELCDHLWLDHMACGHCGRVFETFELKKQHDTEAHNRCAVCYRFFVSSAELKQHRETHQVEPSIIQSPVVEPSVVHPLPAKPEPIPSLQRASKQLYQWTWKYARKYISAVRPSIGRKSPHEMRNHPSHSSYTD